MNSVNHIPTSIAPQGRIIPVDIPSDAVPLTDKDEIEFSRRELHHGTNMFVTLTNGKNLVGRVEVLDPYTFTVGNSDPIEFVDLKSAVST